MTGYQLVGYGHYVEWTFDISLCHRRLVIDTQKFSNRILFFTFEITADGTIPGRQENVTRRFFPYVPVLSRKSEAMFHIHNIGQLDFGLNLTWHTQAPSG